MTGRHALAVVGHMRPAAAGDQLSAPHALAALAALGQPTRLEIFRLLMRREPQGLPAGAIDPDLCGLASATAEPGCDCAPTDKTSKRRKRP